jgi:hypothetical protein
LDSYADICCFFVRRGFSGTRPEVGQVGMIATKSIAEGDSRLVGLVPIIESNGVIRWVRHEIKWPGTAGVTVSLLVISKNEWRGMPVLNDRVVTAISSRFTEEESSAYPLGENKGNCSDGIKIQGDGFIISDQERASLLAAEAKATEVISPYITGMDMAQGIGCRPGAWIINFRTWDRGRASAYRGPFDLLVQRVKPYRESLIGQIHERDFWKYWDKREQFFDRMSGSNRILACPSTAKFMIMTFIEKDWIASHSVKLFAYDDDWSFTVMQSTVHEMWAREHSGKLEQRLAYNLSKAFATFPWPEMSKEGRGGKAYCDARASMSEQRGLCFTDLYNLFHDRSETRTDIEKLRQLHVEMDNAIAAAYGWTDLDLGHGFHETKQGIRYTISEPARREVLARLLKLNHERYADEVKQGLHEKKGSGKSKKKKSDDLSCLFGGPET